MQKQGDTKAVWKTSSGLMWLTFGANKITIISMPRLKKHSYEPLRGQLRSKLSHYAMLSILIAPSCDYELSDLSTRVQYRQAPNDIVLQIGMIFPDTSVTDAIQGRKSNSLSRTARSSRRPLQVFQLLIPAKLRVYSPLIFQKSASRAADLPFWVLRLPNFRNPLTSDHQSVEKFKHNNPGSSNTDCSSLPMELSSLRNPMSQLGVQTRFLKESGIEDDSTYLTCF